MSEKDEIAFILDDSWESPYDDLEENKTPSNPLEPEKLDEPGQEG